MLALTREQYKLQGELVDETMAWFDKQFAAQQAIQQPIIDQQLETLINQSEFAKSQQQRYLSEGVPAQDAAAQALQDLANTPEGQQFISALSAKAAEVGGTEGEMRFRDALQSYGISPQETAYLTQLSDYQDPQVLKDKLAAATEYQNPAEVQTAIDKLSGYDSTARVNEAMGLAAADVRASGEAARVAAMQELEKYGIDPSQLVRGALDRGLRAQTDAQAAMAANQARRDVQATGLQADVQAAQIASQASITQLQTQLDAAGKLMESRIRELQMQGLSAEEARMQADREIGYSGQLAQLEVAQRGESLGYLGEASRQANTVQAQQIAGKVDAYNLYAGNPTTSAQAFGTAGAAGGQASGIAEGQTATGLGAYNTFANMRQGQMNTAAQGFNVANNIYGNNIQNAQNSASAAMGPWNLLGSVVGMGVGGFMGMEEGGPVPEHASPSRGAIPDDVKTALTAGEYVIPEDVARWFGEEKLGKLIEKARTDRAERAGVPIPGMGQGSGAPGSVAPAIPTR